VPISKNGIIYWSINCQIFAKALLKKPQILNYIALDFKLGPNPELVEWD